MHTIYNLNITMILIADVTNHILYRRIVTSKMINDPITVQLLRRKILFYNLFTIITIDRCCLDRNNTRPGKTRT